jgi:hypothetical protein
MNIPKYLLRNRLMLLSKDPDKKEVVFTVVVDKSRLIVITPAITS